MTTNITLDTNVKELQGVGKRYRKRLERLGLTTVRDLLFHLPRRYEDFSDVRRIDDLVAGQPITIQGVVRSISSRRAKRKRLTITEALIEDNSGSIRAVWFNQPYLKRTLPEGTAVSLAGKVSVDYDGAVLSNPSYEKIPREVLDSDPNNPNASENNEKIVHKNLSYTLTGIFFEIQKEVGRNCRERQYADLLEQKLREADIAFEREYPIEVSGRKSSFADFLVEDKIIVEIKTKPYITKDDYRQTMRYLETANKELGLLVNFQQKHLKPKRVLNSSFKKEDEEFGSFGSDSGHSDRSLELRHTGRLVPIYPETRGLSSRMLRFLVESVLALVADIDDPIPANILERHNYPSLSEALQSLHRPANEKEAERARERLAFEELLLLQLHVLREKKERKQSPGISIPFAKKRTKTFTEALPFTLTDAQRRAAWEIIQDLQQNEPMARLLEGDVGSGKTVVAVMAALQAADAGHQTAFMAPTEILAQQHHAGIVDLLHDEDLSIALLTSSAVIVNGERASRERALTAIVDGDIDLIVGTHALIQNDVAFASLALAIVDEQHRFGVEQRATLLETDDAVPHLLSMTATPIPRTLALTLYGDLDLSILDEMPEGRKRIETRVVAPGERDRVYDFMRSELDAGRQAFVVCPLIEDSDEIESRSVEQEYDRLCALFDEDTVGMLHGQMPAQEKEEMMQHFVAGEIGILISTSVVEVGIDVPNATVMVIEGAERFGLAQLHQFRGRVGRGKHQSHCFLLSDNPSKKTRARLDAILEARNGFELAEKDLHIRGPGQFLGTQQSGLPDLAMASLKDVTLIKNARHDAERLLDDDLSLASWPALERAVEGFEARIHPE